MRGWRHPRNLMRVIHSFRPIYAVLILALSAASAHESPEHTIHALDERTELTPAQLHQRALAHRAIHELEQAICDLQAAIAREPGNLGYRLELCGAQLAAGEAAKAQVLSDN